MAEDFHAGLRRAGRKAGRIAEEHAGGGDVGHAVHVLARVKTVDNRRFRFLKMRGQGPQQQNAVYVLPRVQRVDHIEQSVPRYLRRQRDLFHGHAAQRRPLFRAARIAEIVRPLAAAHDGQGWDKAAGLKPPAVLINRGLHGRVDLFSKQKLCHGGPPLSEAIRL